MNVTIGSAPDSWGVWFPDDPRQTPWPRFLDELVIAGYQWTELGPFGYLPTDLGRLNEELDRRGVKVSGTFIMADLEDAKSFPKLEEEVRAVCEVLQSLGAKFLVLIDGCYTDLFSGDRLLPERLEENAWKALVETTLRVGELAHDYGLTLVVHPHADTHLEYEDQIEALLDQTDPNLVNLCLDTGHHAYRGGDPVAFMEKHHNRIPYLHLKSVDDSVRAKAQAEQMPFAAAVAAGMFCEPSQGVVDFPAFRDVLRRIDFCGCAIVEQDMFPVPWDKPLPIAKRTRQYLREIGLG